MRSLINIIMTHQFDNLCNLIYETPDRIIIGDRVYGYKDYRAAPVTFTIIDDMAIYSDNIQITHMALSITLEDAIQKSRRNLKTLQERLQLADIYIINPDKSIFDINLTDLIRRFRKMAEEGGTILTKVVDGRFWGIDEGYVCFWEKQEVVRKHLPAIERLIHHLSYDPKKVQWEVRKAGKEKLVSYEEFKGHKETKETPEEERDRAFKYALHTQPGLKKLAGMMGPPKKRPEAEFKTLEPEN